MPAKKKHAARRKSVVDVTSPADVIPFQDLLKKNKLTVILVWANYCGHCTTYKDEVWKPLTAMPNRNVGLSTVHYDQLENAGLGSAKIDGYPSILLVGNDKVPAEFNEEGQTTNALPNARDMNLMKTIVTSEPEQVINSIPNMVRAPNVATAAATAEPQELPPNNLDNGSAKFDPETESLRKELSRSLAAAAATGKTPPNEPFEQSPKAAVPSLQNDVLDTQTRATGTGALQYEYSEGAENGEPKRVGGNLYSSLVQAAASRPTAAAKRKTRRRGGRSGGNRKRSKKLSRRRRA